MGKRMKAIGRAAAVAFLLAAAAVPVKASDPAADLFTGARAIYQIAAGKAGDERLADMRTVRGILDAIVANHPASPLATAIRHGGVVEGIDIDAVNTTLLGPATPSRATDGQGATPAPQIPVFGVPEAETTGTATGTDTAAPTTTATAPAVPVFGAPSTSGSGDTGTSGPLFGVPTTPEASATGGGLQLVVPTTPALPPRPEKEIVRDVQEGLNRLGCGAGGADGVAGSKTKRAFRRFASVAAPGLSEEMLATEAAVAALNQVTDPVCTARWLAQNQPEAMDGTWGARADCKGFFRTTRITATIRIDYKGGNEFGGWMSNSMGQSGPIWGRISGNAVYTTAKPAGHTVNTTLYTSTKSMTLSGTDSNGCKVVAWKN